MRIRLSWLFAFAMISLAVVSQSAWETRVPLVANLLFVLATILVGIATTGRLWCSLYIAGYKRKTLIMDGPYSLCRNPLYFFSFLGAVGVGCATETICIPLVILVAFATYYRLVIRKEEIALLALHGETYAKYLQQVPRFFPQLMQINEPLQWIANPIIFRRHIYSALWFIWLIGLAELIEGLHEAHYLPAVQHLLSPVRPIS